MENRTHQRHRPTVNKRTDRSHESAASYASSEPNAPVDPWYRQRNWMDGWVEDVDREVSAQSSTRPPFGTTTRATVDSASGRETLHRHKHQDQQARELVTPTENQGERSFVTESEDAERFKSRGYNIVDSYIETDGRGTSIAKVTVWQKTKVHTGTDGAGGVRTENKTKTVVQKRAVKRH